MIWFNLVIAILLFFIFLLILISILFKPEIKSTLERDPAARSYLEVLLLYQGLHAIILHRLAQFFLRLRLKFIARLTSQISRHLTGMEIHPGARIGRGLFIDHGMGVVIGETTIIGDDVTLFQGVTLGGTGKEKGKRHPTIGNNVVIGGGAKVLGNITIGDNSYIGANAVVVKDIPSNSTVVGVPGRITKQNGKKIEISLDHIHILDPIMSEIEELKKRIENLEKK